MSDLDTRDIAVRAESLVNQHMQDCATFRQNLAGKFGDIRQDSIILNNKIDALGTRLSLVMGGLIAAGKLIDYGLTFVRH